MKGEKVSFTKTERISAVLAIVLWTLFLIFSVFRGKPDGEKVFELYRVRPGDTLYEIAQEANEKGDVKRDVRDIVFEIKEENKLSSSSLFEGDVLKIPVMMRK